MVFTRFLGAGKTQMSGVAATPAPCGYLSARDRRYTSEETADKNFRFIFLETHNPHQYRHILWL